MKRFAVIIVIVTLFGCAHNGAAPTPSEGDVKEYSATAISLSDFSMKTVAYYQSRNLPIPVDFDARQFFALLKEIYPDQSRVSFVQSNYKVSVRPLDGGYSAMLCDPQTNRKIMEDLSCHLDRVEIRSWQSGVESPCVFESNWKPYCQ
jgi:hypothetical protein